MVSNNSKTLKIFVYDTIDLGGIKKKTFKTHGEKKPFIREIFDVVKVLLDNNALSRPPTFNNDFWLVKAG
jgi:predicted metal-dependent enzyme (double-stranded beta helix superfamily)